MKCAAFVHSSEATSILSSEKLTPTAFSLCIGKDMYSSSSKPLSFLIFDKSTITFLKCQQQILQTIFGKNRILVENSMHFLWDLLY